MVRSPTPPAAAPTPAPRWARVLLTALLLAWAVFQIRHTTTVAAGSDSSGYLNFARLLAAGELSAAHRLPPGLPEGSNPVHFIPLGFWPMPDTGRMAPTYPPGLPLHLAGAGLLLGWQTGPLAVIVGGAVAGLLLIYLAARELGLPPASALAGAAMLGLSPVFVFTSLQPLSDTLATTWCCAAFYAALRARRGGQAWSVATGAAVAVAVLVRPTDVLIVPALVVLLGTLPRLAGATLGGLPGALWLGYVNQHLYGHPLASGYGDVLQTLGREWLSVTLVHYARWLPTLLPALLLVLPWLALLRWRQQGRALLALGLWWFAFLAFYGFYSVTHEAWWCLRFILPALPALILGALLGLEAWLDRASRASLQRRQIAAAGLALWSGALLVFWTPRLELLSMSRYEKAYEDATRWAGANLPAGSVVATLAASGAIHHYTPFAVLRWDTMQPAEFARYRESLERNRQPLFALLFPHETAALLAERLPGDWEKVAEISGLTYWKNVTAGPAP